VSVDNSRYKKLFSFCIIQRVSHSLASTKDRLPVGTINLFFVVVHKGKLGKGFASVDCLEEMDIGDGSLPRPTYINANLPKEQKDKVRFLAREFINCFALNYTEMLGLGKDLVEHRLPIKEGFRPFKQPPRNYNPLLYDCIKEEIN
jgi:hypothetical protein